MLIFNNFCLLFLFLLVYGIKENQLLAAYSGYFNPLYGGLDLMTTAEEEVTTLGIIFQITIFLVLLIIVLLMTLCILLRYSKRTQEGGEEIITLRNSFRWIWKFINLKTIPFLFCRQLLRILLSMPDFFRLRKIKV